MKRIVGRLRVSSKTVITAGVSAIAAVALMAVTIRAFNPQPEPPGFGLVTLVAGQSIRVNVVCSEHAAGRLPAGPCAGELMIHDMEGNTLASQEVRLRPGQAASLPLTIVRDIGDPIGIDPCWQPSEDNHGAAIPSAEVFSTDTGRTMLFLNPAAARISAFWFEPLEPARH